jgi:hypothetical protein
MEGIKTDTEIGKIPGQADAFKICIESPLCDVIVGQGIYDFLRDLFSLCKVNDLHLAAIDRVAEEQDLKVRRLCVFVNAAFVQIDVGKVSISILMFFNRITSIQTGGRDCS